MSCPPYLGAIKSHVQMAFPTSKVTVWAEDSPFYPHEMMIRARVDNCGAYTHIIVGRPSSEEHIADILIAEIKAVIGDEATE